MSRQPGNPEDLSDVSFRDTYVMVTGVSTKIWTAGDKYLKVIFTNLSNNADIWIKLQPASTDNLVEGHIFVPRRSFRVLENTRFIGEGVEAEMSAIPTLGTPGLLVSGY